MAFPVGRTLFSAVCVGIVVYGVLDFMTNYEQNKCYMTYMFEMPEYLRIPVFQGKKNPYPKYGLYAYGEGKGNYQGIPVLFIPGNSGSHKQARSLGSVAMRRQMDKRTPFLFNYFTVDFHEELSGLYGGVLKQQTEFVHFCIKRILKLYTDFKPTSVILVGHSMGGMIARALFTLPNFDHSLVNTIITQATSHQEPVLALDHYLMEFYNDVNQYWRKYGSTKLSHVTVVSTGGGLRDLLIRNGLTSLRGTTAMPHAWVSTDHLCAVWCKQVVLATVRAMFDIVDRKTNQLSLDVNYRMSVFRHHFLSHTGTRKFVHKWQRKLTLDDSYHWVEQVDGVWEFAEARVMEPRYLVVPINENSVKDSFVAISNVMSDDWICVCKLNSGEKRCKTCENLSSKGNVIPPLDSGRKVLHIRLSDYKAMTHIVLIVPKSHDKVEVMGDLYTRSERHLSYRLPTFSDMLLTYPESVTKGTSVLTLYNDTLYYNLTLLGMDTVLKAFHIQLQPQKCSSKTDLHDGNMMSLHIPWSNEDVYSFNKLGEVGNLTVKLQNGISQEHKDDTIHMRVYIDPACTYLLRIMVSPLQILGQVS
ncbi:hypothetical protein FSP39_001388 [Pinctada imbricata]|uniref:GPI inositol-deacylase n=1 Tax=Pinctada imbricata TaxID=66713 RepID=A0AA88Y499_PINIB|nr:hypothetical protein FSP39_001388 [Pinctada imbricata]